MSAAVLVVAFVLASAPTVNRLILLLCPMICLLVVEWTPPSGFKAVSRSGHSLLREIMTVGVGILLPLSAYAMSYWRIGGLDELYRGVVLVPSIYVGDLSIDLPGIKFALGTLVAALIVWRTSTSNAKAAVVPTVLVLTLLILGYLFNPTTTLLTVYTSLIWLSLALALLYAYARRRWPNAISDVVVVVTIGAISLQLLRFPASNIYYTVHALPLVVLAILMVTWQMDRRVSLGVLTAFASIAVLFGMAKLDGRFFADGTTGVREEYVQLDMERGGLRVPGPTAYINDLVAEIGRNSTDGSVILAGPDSPEIYYLSGVPNPTRVLFDFLSTDAEPPATTETFLDTLDLDLFVDNRDPEISPVVDSRHIPQSCDLLDSFGPRDLYACG